MNERFTIATDTVLDKMTGRMWQRHVPFQTFTWSKATEYALELRLGGYSDWRLPTIEELLSIVDPSRHKPAIDSVAFPDTPSEWFWSSSPYAYDTINAWGVSFNFGFTTFSDTTNSYRVRCAR